MYQAQLWAFLSRIFLSIIFTSQQSYEVVLLSPFFFQARNSGLKEVKSFVQGHTWLVNGRAMIWTQAFCSIKLYLKL